MFHTAAGFELAKQPFIEALMPAERTGLEQLRKAP